MHTRASRDDKRIKKDAHNSRLVHIILQTGQDYWYVKDVAVPVSENGVAHCCRPEISVVSQVDIRFSDLEDLS